MGSGAGEVGAGSRCQRRIETSSFRSLSATSSTTLRCGGEAVTLRAARCDERVELHVQDDGGGFPPDFLARAFDRFTRGDAAHGRGGSGLGLAIVKTIADAHDATAHVANSPAGGADGWISLPGQER